ncbi:MAG: hypothetical protein IT299_10915 [Dehalococcoidia bacterium]|nr:hypothetical protein [Dehalococcoidia bacterium]
MLGKLIVFGIVAGAAYIGARRLIDDPALIGQLPEPARDPARQLRLYLVEIDEILREAMQDAASEREAAEQALREDYMSRTRRASSPMPGPESTAY